MGGWAASSMAKTLCCVSAGLVVGGVFEEGLGKGAGGAGGSQAAATFKAKGAAGAMGTPLGSVIWLSQRYWNGCCPDGGVGAKGVRKPVATRRLLA